MRKDVDKRWYVARGLGIGIPVLAGLAVIAVGIWLNTMYLGHGHGTGFGFSILFLVIFGLVAALLIGGFTTELVIWIQKHWDDDKPKKRSYYADDQED